MKHSIIEISEATNEREIERAKAAKEFHRCLVGLVASASVGMLGVAAYTVGDPTPLSVGLGVFTQVICQGLLTPNLVHRLVELHKEKSQISQNEMDGGMHR